MKTLDRDTLEKTDMALVLWLERDFSLDEITRRKLLKEDGGPYLGKSAKVSHFIQYAVGKGPLRYIHYVIVVEVERDGLRVWLESVTEYESYTEYESARVKLMSAVPAGDQTGLNLN